MVRVEMIRSIENQPREPRPYSWLARNRDRLGLAAAAALLPKCPLCYMAYCGAVGFIGIRRLAWFSWAAWMTVSLLLGFFTYRTLRMTRHRLAVSALITTAGIGGLLAINLGFASDELARVLGCALLLLYSCWISSKVQPGQATGN